MVSIMTSAADRPFGPVRLFGGLWSDTSPAEGNFYRDEMAELGRVVLNFSSVDWCAERLLAGFLSSDLTGLVVVTAENTSWKLDKLSVISKEILPESEHRVELRHWLAGVKLLNRERNLIMHSVWGPGPDDKTLVMMKVSARNGEFKGNSKPANLAYLKDVADALAGAVDLAHQLVEKLGQSCPEWHGRKTLGPPA